MRKLKIAILDFYKGEANQGMRGILDILARYGAENELEIEQQIFDVRRAMLFPSLDFDAYIFTGGPGSPVDAEGWESGFVSLVDGLIDFNKNNDQKKYGLFICHSFQLMCHHYGLANVCLRKSESFGTFPVHKTGDGENERMFKNLQNPFWAVDSRKWQVIEPNASALEKMGAKILALEKIRPHVDLERCLMAIRFTPEMIGTQFHPEADAEGMRFYLQTEAKKQVVIKNHGEDKYENMLEHLSDPDKIMLTQHTIIPAFLDEVLKVESVC